MTLKYWLMVRNIAADYFRVNRVGCAVCYYLVDKGKNIGSEPQLNEILMYVSSDLVFCFVDMSKQIAN